MLTSTLIFLACLPFISARPERRPEESDALPSAWFNFAAPPDSTATPFENIHAGGGGVNTTHVDNSALSPPPTNTPHSPAPTTSAAPAATVPLPTPSAYPMVSHRGGEDDMPPPQARPHFNAAPASVAVQSEAAAHRPLPLASDGVRWEDVARVTANQAGRPAVMAVGFDVGRQEAGTSASGEGDTRPAPQPAATEDYGAPVTEEEEEAEQEQGEQTEGTQDAWAYMPAELQQPQQEQPGWPSADGSAVPICTGRMRRRGLC